MDVGIPKLKRDWVGRHVRLLREIETAGGVTFEAGEVMLVTRNYGGLHLRGAYECGECARRFTREVKHINEGSVELMPQEWSPATHPTRAELAEHCKDLDAKIRYLLDEGKLYGPEGFTFPDGDTWERPGG